MAVFQVQGPDGKIHELEGPDDATPEEIEAFAAETIKDEPEYETTPEKAYAAGLMKGVPLATDAAAMGAAVYGMTKGVPFGEGRVAARDYFKDQQAQGEEQYPGASISGTVLGGVGAGMAVPLKLLQGASVASRAGKAGLVAGAFGAGYGFGDGEGFDERAGNAIQQGVMAAPLGVGGSVAVDGASAAIKAAIPHLKGARSSLAERARALLNRRSQSNPADDINSAAFGQNGTDYLGAAQDALNRPVDTSLNPGVIPLTKGQLTQDPRAQALEFGAQTGNYGDDAQKMALEARELQSDAAKGALQKAAGSQIDETTAYGSARNIQQNLSEAYKKARMETRQAYGKVGELTQEAPLKVGAEYLKKTVVPSLEDWARKGGSGTGFDLMAPGMENAKRLYSQAQSVARVEKLNAINFSRMEQWRGRVSQGIQNSKTPAEKAFLSGLVERFDTAMDQLPREAIKSGDDAVIRELERARSARAYQGRTFERNKVIADILENDQITNEELAGVLFSVKQKGFKGDAGTALTSMINAVGDKGPEVLQSAKAGVYSKVLRNSLTAELKQGGGEMVSFDKLVTNLKELVNDNPTLFKTLHTPDEQAFIRQLLDDAKKIKSVKPGSRNYSNTAYTLLNFMRSVSPAATKTSIPLVGSLGGGIETIAKESATLDLERSLAPVFRKTADELSGPAYNFIAKYGRPAAIGGAAAQSQDRPTVTVNPNSGVSGTPPQVDLPSLGE